MFFLNFWLIDALLLVGILAMKNSMVSLALLAGLLKSAFALGPGDEVSLSAITQAEFIQGEAPAAWQEGEVYVFECWATWCGPCLAAIPHVDALHDKYHSQGLRVIGMNVWEKKEEAKKKVEAFVAKKGEGMSYPVAYVSEGGAFVQDWLKPAGVRGIPHAFVVMDGKLQFSIHPSALTEERVEDLLAGGERARQVAESVQREAEQKDQLREQMRAFSQAARQGDAAKMRKALAKLEKMEVRSGRLAAMKLDLAVTEERWDDVLQLLKDSKGQRSVSSAAISLAVKIDEKDVDIPADLLAFIADQLAKSERSRVPALALEARVRWRMGEEEAAKNVAQRLAELENSLPAQPVEAFAASFLTGEPQTFRSFSRQLVEARKEEKSAQ
ncbi:MAG: TlpA disulfide reductase family protein [Verrucomicrobiota bacterium JB023]|nr:TlpA disulfide reductase family protein [Verrucomicrobiota bacterium JB023]